MSSCLDSPDDGFEFQQTYFETSIDILYLDVETFQHYRLDIEGSFQSGLHNMNSAQLFRKENLAMRIFAGEVLKKEVERSIAMILNHFPRVLNIHIIVSHYTLDKCKGF